MNMFQNITKILFFSFLFASCSYREIKPEIIDRAVKRLEHIRGLPVKKSIQAQLASPKYFHKKRSENLIQELSEEDYIKYVEALQILGFLPENIKFRYQSAKRTSSNVTGYYDPKESTLRILLKSSFVLDIRERAKFLGEDIIENTTFAHELTHALVDQHFSLYDLIKLEEQQNTDKLLARRALIEGDAQYSTFLYQGGKPDYYQKYQYDLTSKLRRLDRHSSSGIISLLNQFPYLHGGLFVSILAKEGEFSRVNQAYQDPPNSTSEIMHVSRYLFGPRVKVRLPVLTSLLNQFETNSTVLLEDTLGEFRLGLLLSRFIKEKPVIKSIEGWSGDRFAVLKQENGTPLILFASVWEGEDNAKEFSRTMINWLVAKNTSNSSIEWKELSESHALAKNGEHYIGVLQREERVVWVEGTSRKELAPLLLALLKAIPEKSEKTE